MYSVLCKDQFDAESFILNQTILTLKKDKKIEEECFKMYPKTDCMHIYYVESLQTSYRLKANSLYLNLNFENVIEQEKEYNILRVLSDMLNY